MKKRNVLWIFALLMLGTALLFTGCGDKDGNEGGTDSAPDTEEATEPPVTYTADSLVFETFQDMKKNAALYADQAPCTRSTKGYYSVGDSGAATYSIVKKKPEGIFERLADGLWAEIVLEEGKTSVTPQMFGAKGDGKADDMIALNRAIQYAQQNEIQVELPEANYYSAKQLVLKDITIVSHNATFTCHDMTKNVAAVDVKSNVNIYGTFNVFHADNKASNHGGRCAIGFGYYGTGEGAHNCYLEHVVLTGGGFVGANGILVTGDSSNLTFGKITVPEGTKYGRAFMAHWGNANDHNAVSPGDPSQGMGHKPDADYTKHAHNVKIGTIEFTGARKSLPERSSALCLSSVYDFTIDEIIVDSVESAVELIPGDGAMEWASPEVKAIGMSGIHIKKVTGTNLRGTGIFVSMYTGYVPEADVMGRFQIDEVDISGGSLQAAPAVLVYRVAELNIQKLTIRNYYMTAIDFRSNCRNVNIQEANLINCKGDAIVTEMGYSMNVNSENIEFGTLNIQGGGKTDKHVVKARLVDGLKIGTVNLTGGASYQYLIGLYANANNIRIGTINAAEAGASAVVKALQTIPTTNHISIGSYSCGQAALTSGSVTVKVGENNA